MTNLEELKIAKNYYEAKYLYIAMKIKKLEAATQSPTETEYNKIITDDKITITEVESEIEEENESETDVSSFFSTMILKDDNAKIKRSDCFNFYVKYCKTQQIEPKIKSIFFKSIESFLGKPTKTNVYYYKHFKFVESDAPLTFNQSIEDLIF